MEIKVLTLKRSTYICLSCGIRVEKIVYLNFNKHPKGSPEITVGFHTFLCEKCFKKMFIKENWLRYWRVELKTKIIKR